MISSIYYSTISELADQIRIAQQVSYEYCLRELLGPASQEQPQTPVGLDEELCAAIRARMLHFARHSAQELLRDALFHNSSGQLLVPLQSRSPFGAAGRGGGGVGIGGVPSASMAPASTSTAVPYMQLLLPSTPQAQPEVTSHSQSVAGSSQVVAVNRVVVLEQANAREQRAQQQRTTGGLFKKLGFKK